MSKRKAVYVFDHNSIKAKKLLKAYKTKDKKLYKDFDQKTLVDIVAYLIEQNENRNLKHKNIDEYDLDDLEPEDGELEYYLKRSEKSCLSRNEFIICRENFYSDYLLQVNLIPKQNKTVAE